MIGILLCLFIMFASSSGNQFAANLAQFVCILTFPAGLLILFCLGVIAYTDIWGKRGKSRPIRSKIIRILQLATVITLAANGWYWSAFGWLWWWFTIETLAFAYRNHWREVDAVEMAGGVM